MTGPRAATRNRNKKKWIGLAAGVAALVAVAFLLPTRALVESLSNLIERAGPWGPVALGAAYVIGCLLLFPGSALTILAGALFGLTGGLLVAFPAATIAAAAAFLLGRHVARDLVRKLAHRHRAFSAFDRAIEHDGWKVVALMRLSPAVPFSASNYLFGLTGVGFWPYLAASAVAMLPGTFLYVYLGHAGMAGVNAVAHGGARGSWSSWQWALLIVGLAATAATVVYVSRLARKRLHRSHAR